MQNRREFLVRAAALSGAWTAGFGGLARAMAGPSGARLTPGDGFGPLIEDSAGVFDLPAGFAYRVISRAGDRMDDGFVLPGKPDAMAAFEAPGGLTVVVRNHELERVSGPSPFGSDGEPAAELPAEMIFDGDGPRGPSRGGTTNLVYDTREQRVVRQFLTLVGTERNCAGGPTPRGTWLTCEESVIGTRHGYGQEHGWVFEVPATTEPGLVRPIPLRAMGRFNHEACATDPATGIVYQTEDRHDGLLYRFLPRERDNLAAGGRLEALVVEGREQLDTRNWGGAVVGRGERLPCRWVECEDVEAPLDDLRLRGFEAGAARFARGEGMWRGEDGIYFACTNGGPAMCGQIWRHVPGAGPAEGGTLELFVESPGPGVMQNADNITVAPWGDLIVCEDGAAEQFLLGITPEGEVYRLGRNALSTSELAGACFSPDGSTLFVNVQHDGPTLAITGPWRR